MNQRRVEGPIDARPGCVATLPAEYQTAFERARTHYETDVFKRFQQPLEQHWKPYVENRVTLPQAARRLLAAMK